MEKICYPRRELRGDVLYNYYRFREVSLTVSKMLLAVTRIVDTLALALEEAGLISAALRRDFEALVLAEFSDIVTFDDWSPQAIYRHIHSLRVRCFGAEVLEDYARQLAQRGVDFVPAIDQSDKKRTLIDANDTLTVVLTQPELTKVMEEDLRDTDKRIIRCDSLPDAPEGAVLYYGEEGLLECRGLTCDAVVTAIPAGFHAQALTNLWGGEGCVVYIPAGFDITPHVPLTSKTRLTFAHLAQLQQLYGDGVYRQTVEALYRAYPEFFVNVYHNAPSGMPVAPEDAADPETFDRRTDEKLTEFLGGFENAGYISAYFDEDLVRRPICYDAAQKQPGILVQAARIKGAAGARVLACEKGVTPRRMFRDLKLPGTALVSNFLFFMTPKLGGLYNDLRNDRPLEQADAASGHLDYMLCRRDDKRVETFPLFGKSCIAMRDDGSFLFCNFYLGGGQAEISGVRYRWEKADVNGEGDIRICTPHYSVADRDADRDTYVKAVGSDRVNVVILREKVTCIRRGDVILPSVGVVLSLTEEAAQPLLDKLTELENGYYDVRGLELTVQLDPPEGVSDWSRVRWAYGGGLTLIKKGVGLCDGEHMEQWFDREGWTSPLSRQTQESNLHSLVKHPRTAIGCAENGDLLVLVYSGRTWRSTGADYGEMIAIARQLFPDVQALMNCDGGGSAMLGVVHEGEFMELSCPSTSANSCAGQVRPINTVFYIPLEEKRG